jgi:hypothetical protein
VRGVNERQITNAIFDRGAVLGMRIGLFSPVIRIGPLILLNTRDSAVTI